MKVRSGVLGCAASTHSGKAGSLARLVTDNSRGPDLCIEIVAFVFPGRKIAFFGVAADTRWNPIVELVRTAACKPNKVIDLPSVVEDVRTSFASGPELGKLPDLLNGLLTSGNQKLAEAA